MFHKEVDLLIKNSSELITLQGSSQRPFVGKQMTDLKIIKGGGIAIDQGRIVAIGRTQNLEERFEGRETINAEGKVVMPGFVDPHTHLVFAGSREDEFEMRIKGISYMEILKRGGGILKTVKATREASEKQLVELCKTRLDTMLEHGTTTVEAKSGYGLSVTHEIKCLKALKHLNEKHPIDLVPTFLGAHVTPHEYQNNTDEYLTLVIDKMIPEVAKHKLAEFCDIFCETNVFSVEQSRRVLLSGMEYGLKPKLHADEMTRIGGAELAAEVGAVSADHLIFSSDEGLRAMADRGVVAVLLPGASFSLMMGRYADARKMIALGVPVALGTDFNPVCWVENQQLILALACRQMGMTPAEAITATTINAAHAIRRAHEVGSLEPGKQADILVLNVPNHRFLGYRFGVNLVDKVVKNGRIVVDHGRLIE